MSKDYPVEIDLNYPNDSHTKLVMMCGSGKTVLDVGCARGDMARLLKQRGCLVTGIEINPEAAREAEKVCERVIVGDLDQLELDNEFPETKFDAILFGDVIEHLKSPSRVLNQARQLLSPGGFIGVSVPNVAHASIRLMLLEGEFAYQDIGLLDDSHLRFFTRESFCDLLNACGYVIDSLEYIEHPVGVREIEDRLDPLRLGNLEEVIKSFTSRDAAAFQYVARAHPASEPERLCALTDEKVRAQRTARKMESELFILRDAINKLAPLQQSYLELEEAYGALEGESEKRRLYIEELGRIVAEKDSNIVTRDSRIRELEAELSIVRNELDTIKVELSRLKDRPL